MQKQEARATAEKARVGGRYTV